MLVNCNNHSISFKFEIAKVILNKLQIFIFSKKYLLTLK